MRNLVSLSVMGLFVFLAATRSVNAQELPFNDALIQAPSLEAPEPASIAGAFSKTAFGPTDLARGVYSLPSPVRVPETRGSMLAQVLPTYSPENGLDVWGMGWSSNTTITRTRHAGDLDYKTDDFSSPWGILTLASDGDYYPRGFRSKIRVKVTDSGFEAIDPQGIRYFFDNTQAERNPANANEIYRWHLTRVVPLHGLPTDLQYDVNESGRRFIKRVEFGGFGAKSQVAVDFTYDLLPVPFRDYRAGFVLELDRRVARVTSMVRRSGHGPFEPRWSHELQYRESETGLAFYLARVQQVFASGEAAPSYEYRYDTGVDQLRDAEWHDLVDLNRHLTQHQLGKALLNPNNIALVDIDRDGMLDFEVKYDQEFFRRTSTGYVRESLRRADDAVVQCLPSRGSSASMPRRLVRLHPEQTEPKVFASVRGNRATVAYVCDRSGRLHQRLTLPDGWALTTANVRLVDVNRDHRPDLVRVAPGRYEVMINESTRDEVKFAAPRKGTIASRDRFSTVWFQDMNGDGVVDMVLRYYAALVIHNGVGHGEFAADGHGMRLYREDGQLVTDISRFVLEFTDLNKDGLSDIFLSNRYGAAVYANFGDRFVETHVEALASVGRDGFVVTTNISGSAESEINFVHDDGVKTLALSTPSAGLLVSADDGKGTLLSFEYERMTPVPGAGHRSTVLSSMSVTSGGYDDITYVYSYEGPVLHGQNHALIGFEQTQRTSPLTFDEVTFYHDEEVSNVVLSSHGRDTRTSFYKFTETEYEDGTFAGLPYVRPKKTRTGFRTNDDALELAQTSQVLAYDNEFCAVKTRKNGPRGTLLQETSLDAPAALIEALHCTPKAETWTGTHPNSSLDFTYSARLERNHRAQVEKAFGIDVKSGTQSLLQAVEYDASGRVSAVTEPGKGTTYVTYSPETGLVETVTAPEAVVAIAGMDPVRDAITSITKNRGGDDVISGYAHDGMERLSALWDNVSGTSADVPLTQYAYAYATETQPGYVYERTMMDGGATSRQATLFTAAGEAITKAVVTHDTANKEMLVFGGLTQTFRNEGLTLAFDRAPVYTKDTNLDAITYERLFAGATELSRTKVTGFGEALESDSVVQTGVFQKISIVRTLTSDGVRTTALQNGKYPRVTLTDLEGKVREQTDPAGYNTRFDFDVLGRLIQVDLANGDAHAIRYDGLGRLAEVQREGLQNISYQYQSGTSLLEQKTIATASGQPVREVLFSRDALGRVTQEQHTLVKTGETDLVHYEYDGQVDGRSMYPGQNGHLTRITGKDFEKRFVYDGAERLQRSEIHFPGFRSVIEENAYYRDGKPKTQTTRVLDKDGVQLQTLEQAWEFDRDGRPSAFLVNGEKLASTAYNDRGQVDFVETDLGSMHMHYDGTTQKLRGYTHVSGNQVTDIGWELSDRGLIASEDYSFDEKPTLTRNYTYDDRAFLIGADDEEKSESYSYGPAGRRESISDKRGYRTHNRSGDVLTVGDLQYRYDSIGRMVERVKDGVVSNFVYGPRGELETAFVGQDKLEYRYDNENQRLLKKKNGRTVAAYLGSAYLDEQHFVVPVKAGARLLGVLVDGAFEPMDADLRGSVIRKNGPTSIPSAYGLREIRLDLAEALDYAEKGFDKDLGTIRMGVRDYDPELGEFWTPDPLFLEQLDKCAESPVDCNLYAYAKNDPLRFTDPSGLGPEDELRAWVQGFGYSSASEANEIEQPAGFVDGLKDGFVEGATGGCVPAEAPETWMETAGQMIGQAYGQAVSDATVGKVIDETVGRAMRWLGLVDDAARVAASAGRNLNAEAQAARATAPVPKFSDYIFKEGATHGKDAVFRGLGYGKEHSSQLAQMWEQQAAGKFARGEYTLGKLDQYGQRINIEIEVPGIGDAVGKTSHMQSGWMIQADGTIKLNTPFSGFTR